MQWQRAELAERLSKVLEEKLHQKEASNMEQELQPFLEIRKQQYPDLPEHNQRILAVADLIAATEGCCFRRLG